MHTESPPKARNADASKKRKDSSGIARSATKPFVSSSMPQIVACSGTENIHKNHFWQKLVAILNNMIQPQIVAIDRMDDAMTSEKEGIFVSGRLTDAMLFPFNNAPVRMAENICINQSIHGNHLLEKSTEPMPKINAGPQLLQNPSIRLLSRCVI